MNKYNVVVITDTYEKIEFTVSADFWLTAVSLAMETEIIKEYNNYKMLIETADNNVIKVKCINGKIEIEE